MWHSKITKDVWPRSGIISIKQMRRRDYERAAVQLLRDQGCHVRFAKPHNVREKYAAVLFKNFARAKHGLFLILKAFEPVRDVNVFQFSRSIQFVTEVLIEEF